MTAPYGEIHSPAYPANYPNSVDCSWVISVDPTHRVLFNFTDLDVEYYPDCQNDYVSVSNYLRHIYVVLVRQAIPEGWDTGKGLGESIG